MLNYNETSSSKSHIEIPFQVNLSRSLSRNIIENINRIKADLGGQAAVQEGFISNSMIIVVAVTAIASLAIPYYNMSIVVEFFDM